MRKYLVVAAVALLMAACGSSPVGPTAGNKDSLTGTWVSYQYGETVTLSLAQNGGFVTGSWSGKYPGGSIGGNVSGSITGAVVSLQLHIQGNPCTPLSFSGTREGVDVLNGVVTGCGMGDAYRFQRQ